ncbi:MAG: hypothetical protein ACK5JM_13055 [Rhodoblastus sp.]
MASYRIWVRRQTNLAQGRNAQGWGAQVWSAQDQGAQDQSAQDQDAQDQTAPAEFSVNVCDEHHRRLACVDALSVVHAEKVAIDLMALLRRRDPDGRFILPRSFTRGR